MLKTLRTLYELSQCPQNKGESAINSNAEFRDHPVKALRVKARQLYCPMLISRNESNIRVPLSMALNGKRSSSSVSLEQQYLWSPTTLRKKQKAMHFKAQFTTRSPNTFRINTKKCYFYSVFGKAHFVLCGTNERNSLPLMHFGHDQNYMNVLFSEN